MDPFFCGSDVEMRIRTLLSGKEVSAFSSITPNPRDVDIDQGAELCCKCSADFIVALGGGSAIDSAKAINLVATNGGKSWEYTKGTGRVERPSTKALFPLIAVPTTAGTGTEATRYSVITNSVTHAKATIKRNEIFPTKALVDPDLMASMPRKTTALTGIDAFAHAFEAYIGSKANSFSELFSLQGIRLFAKSIEKACLDGKNTEARTDMALCCTLGGLSISHSATTLPHGIGQALSGVTDAPHGGSIAVCMPNVIRWTLPACKEKFAEVACIFDPSLKDKTITEQANALPDILDNLFSRIIGQKLTMRDYGLTEDKIEAVVDMALSNYSGDVSRHPRLADRDELAALIRACM